MFISELISIVINFLLLKQSLDVKNIFLQKSLRKLQPYERENKYYVNKPYKISIFSLLVSISLKLLEKKKIAKKSIDQQWRVKDFLQLLQFKISNPGRNAKNRK